MALQLPPGSPYLNAKRLAEKLGRARQYVYAMQLAGYEFEFGLTTTLAHAEAWLRKHPTFRTTPYFRKRKAKDEVAAI